MECAPEPAPPDSILLFDGVFLLRRELRGAWDFSIFVTAPFEETMGRAAKRDRGLFGSEQAARRRYAARYVPGQQLYLARDHPEMEAEVVLENADPDHPRLVFRARPDPGGSSAGRS